MLIVENILLALNGLFANKMRALLTMLGIIIGIGSVIAIVTVGNSMTIGLQEEMQSIGASNVQVYLQAKSDEDTTDAGGMTMTMWTPPEEKDLISEEMLDRFRTEFSDRIKYVTYTKRLTADKVKSNAETQAINVMGANEDYFPANNISLNTGRFLTDKDNNGYKKVCVLNKKLTDELFSGEDPIGKTVELRINNEYQTFYIVGVYEKADTSDMFSMDGTTTTTAYIPINTAQKLGGLTKGYEEFTATAQVGVDGTQFALDVDAFFAKEYAKNKSFTAASFSMQEMADSMTSMLTTMSLAISVIAGISLLVGGIGVMNIMLVSITERTREIGTRKALGATNGSIMLQFIVESIIICMVGGIIGVVLGVGLGSAGSSLLGYAAQPSIAIIIIAVGFSMLIGVFFGYYPARKAARLNPIEALRYE